MTAYAESVIDMPVFQDGGSRPSSAVRPSRRKPFRRHVAGKLACGLASMSLLAAADPATSAELGLGGTFKGFVNPLRHYDPDTGRVSILNLSDSEPGSELLDAVQNFLVRQDEFSETVRALSMHRVGKARCDTTVDTQNLWPHADRLEKAGFSLARRYINIGANDGISDDPLYDYARLANATGVAVERSETNCARHRENLPHVRVVCSEVTPQNAVSLVSEAWPNGVNEAGDLQVDILKVDIDSYDCPVLEALLEVVSAKLILVEANPSIPPPYQWAMLHHPELWPFFYSFAYPEQVPIRGCSLAYEVELLRRHGYDFLAFGGHDALFVHRSVRSAWSHLDIPMDEFDCYNEAFIAANGIPISKTRQWFFEINSTHAGLIDIWDFFIGWMKQHSPQIFPFALRV